MTVKGKVGWSGMTTHLFAHCIQDRKIWGNKVFVSILTYNNKFSKKKIPMSFMNK